MEFLLVDLASSWSISHLRSAESLDLRFLPYLSPGEPRPSLLEVGGAVFSDGFAGDACTYLNSPWRPKVRTIAHFPALLEEIHINKLTADIFSIMDPFSGNTGLHYRNIAEHLHVHRSIFKRHEFVVAGSKVALSLSLVKNIAGGIDGCPLVPCHAPAPHRWPATSTCNHENSFPPLCYGPSQLFSLRITTGCRSHRPG
jgi:hypothetical protein